MLKERESRLPLAAAFGCLVFVSVATNCTSTGSQTVDGAADISTNAADGPAADFPGDPGQPEVPGNVTPAPADGASVDVGTPARDGSVVDAGQSEATVVPACAAVGRGVFVNAGEMIEGRYQHSATLLPSGRVLIVGGFGVTPSTQCSGFVALSSAELFNPSTGISTPTGGMPAPAASHTATLLNNGKVLIAGGDTGCGTPTSTALLFDPATGIFSRTGEMTTPRTGHTSTLLANGKVLIAAGDLNDACVPSTAELYDPKNGTFAVTGNMTAARPGHTATLLSNGWVLMAGGDSVNPAGDGGFELLSTADLYHPSNGTFTSAGLMTAVRNGHSATLLPNGKVLLAGGGGLTSAELYDPASGAFSVTGTMALERWKQTATLLKDGKVLVLGDTVAELYDPARQSFSCAGSLALARTEHTATLLANGSVLAMGGHGGCVVLPNAEIFTE